MFKRKVVRELHEKLEERKEWIGVSTINIQDLTDEALVISLWNVLSVLYFDNGEAFNSKNEYFYKFFEMLDEISLDVLIQLVDFPTHDLIRLIKE